MTAVLAAGPLATALAPPGGAQDSTTLRDSTQRTIPFAVGERFEYDVRFGPMKVGRGSMEIAKLDTVRGRDTWHIVFRLRGGTFFYKVDDVFQSWVDTSSLASLRFWSDQREGGREREKRYEIFPERKVYQDGDDEEKESVAEPVDDASILYYVRTLDLEIGRTYELNNYFRPDRNPVKIKVLRRERVTVPAGTFQAIVVQPVIKTKGIFSENGKAEIWLSEDERRAVIQVKSNLSFGTLSLYLRKIRDGGEPTPTER